MPIGIAILLAAFAFPAWSLTESTDIEDTTAHFQLTYNWQRHQAYTGPNSLISGHETMYTFTADAFLGFRPWLGGEMYLTPEVSQGVPFSNNLVGLGGFTNGEITRAAGPNPTLYRQKLFLRQTWNNGGGAEHVEGGQNQLAGMRDKNRIVVTIQSEQTHNASKLAMGDDELLKLLRNTPFVITEMQTSK